MLTTILSFILAVMPGVAWQKLLTLGVQTPAAAGCTTPTGTNLTESFGDAATSCWTSGPSSCDNTWTIYGTAPTGISASPGTPPANTACSNSLRMTYTTGNGLGIYHSVTTSTSADINFELYVNSQSLDTSGVTRIARAFGVGAVATIRLTNNAGTIQIFASGSDDSTHTNITTGTWYSVSLHLDATLANSYISIDGGTHQTFTRNNYDITSVWVDCDNEYLTGNVDYYVGYVSAN